MDRLGVFLARRVTLALAIVLAWLPGAVVAAEASSPPKTTGHRYTFSWPLDDPTSLKPRGGTTQGPEVTLDTSESPQWRALQEPNISPQERDRRAILAMAGTYRVAFDFLEVVPFVGDTRAKAPYQSWGTEKVYVDRDESRFVSLVHILEMRIKKPDGTLVGPMVTKHWRQDWRYEPDAIVEYRGRDQWQRRKLSGQETKGQWVQSVYQVDESPRYASIGRWEHTDSFSTWVSANTWRPLPRREWSVRDDYQVLVGTNRHTITATGWVQEENNLKGVLTEGRQLRAEQPYLAREYGVARYERIRDMDFAAADQYYERTRQFWNEVRGTWGEALSAQDGVTLRGPVDKLGLFMPLFAHADSIADGKPAAGSSSKVIRDALKDMGALR